MQTLPKWCITDTHPALFDVESATVIEQTAKLYGKMNELVEAYNEYTKTLDASVENFKNEQVTDYELYKVAMRQEFQDFIDVIALKVQDATNYMRENLRESCKGILDELSKDAQDALQSIIEIREEVNESISTQNSTIDNQNSILAGAVKKLDTRLTEQDTRIDEAVTYLHDNLETTIENKVTEMIDSGAIVMGLAHNADTEELTMHARNIVYDTDLTLSYEEATETIRINEV